jgi:hypothetical protein
VQQGTVYEVNSGYGGSGVLDLAAPFRKQFHHRQPVFILLT